MQQIASHTFEYRNHRITIAYSSPPEGVPIARIYAGGELIAWTSSVEAAMRYIDEKGDY